MMVKEVMDIGGQHGVPPYPETTNASGADIVSASGRAEGPATVVAARQRRQLQVTSGELRVGQRRLFRLRVVQCRSGQSRCPAAGPVLQVRSGEGAVVTIRRSIHRRSFSQSAGTALNADGDRHEEEDQHRHLSNHFDVSQCCSGCSSREKLLSDFLRVHAPYLYQFLRRHLSWPCTCCENKNT